VRRSPVRTGWRSKGILDVYFSGSIRYTAPSRIVDHGGERGVGRFALVDPDAALCFQEGLGAGGLRDDYATGLVENKLGGHVGNGSVLREPFL
jgi:hypothetical protein